MGARAPNADAVSLRSEQQQQFRGDARWRGSCGRDDSLCDDLAVPADVQGEGERDAHRYCRGEQDNDRVSLKPVDLMMNRRPSLP